jgi:Tol biopolymer transport system component
LNHPHICTLYDVGPNYLVMELCEGETLAARIQRGRISLEDTCRFGSQTASALAAAHAKGIVHRDLKPANIMLTKAGVKVLDFGLAKSDTDTTLTQANLIMGTPAYMSPEQREGRITDHRCDIYALGLVLAEMVTGKRGSGTEAFESSGLARIVSTCTQADPDDRWQSAADLGRSLDWLGLQVANSPAAARTSGRWFMIFPVVLAALALALAVSYWPRTKQAEAALPARFSFDAPQGTEALRSGIDGAVSPDGRHFAFIARPANAVPLIWIRPLDSEQLRSLDGTDGASRPFWSPDSRQIAFFANGKLKRVSIDGGPAQNICNSSAGLGGAWSESGEIVFNPTNRAPLMRVPAGGGTPTQVTQLNDGLQENSHRWPSFLPGGRYFLFTAHSSLRENTAVYIGSLDSADVKRVLTEQSQAIYSAGYLLFGREGNLMAQTFNLAKLQVSGEAAPVTGNLDQRTASATANFTATPDGRTLVYRTSTPSSVQFSWFDRRGEPTSRVGPAGDWQQPALSKDGRKLLAVLTDANTGNRDIWLLDLITQAVTRLTTNPANDWHPVWSPDGAFVAFSSDRTPTSSIWRKALSGDAAEEMIVPPSPDGGAFSYSWSPDGRHIAYQADRAVMTDIWLVAVRGAHERRPWANSSFGEREPSFSPDGKWLAYTSDETGTREVYVKALSGSQRYRISMSGGGFIQWRADGREIFFLSPDRRMMSAEVSLADPIRIGTPVSLFSRCSTNERATENFGVSVDGTRFLFGCLAEEKQFPFTVLLNWPAAVKWQRQ